MICRRICFNSFFKESLFLIAARADDLLDFSVETLSSSEDEEDPAHPLAGVEVTIKSESGLTGGAVLPDNLRDLVVEMAVDLNMPGHIVFEAMQRTIGALGGMKNGIELLANDELSVCVHS